VKPKERVFKALERGIPDRVPVMPNVDGYHAPRIIGLKLGECFIKGEKMASALIAALRYYGYDGTVAEMGLGRDPTRQLGGRVRIQEDDVPIFVDTLIKEPSDIEKLEIPDPFTDDKMEPVKIVLDELGDRYFVMGSVRAPFEYISIVRGFVNMMEDLYSNPKLVKEILRTTTKITIEIGKGLIETGVHGLLVRDSLASSSVISPEHYKKFAFPYEKKAIEKFRKDARVILHICRNSSPIIERMVETGAAGIEIDSLVDISEAKKTVGGRACLKGNVDAVEVVRKGTPADVMRECMECIKGAAGGGGFILSTGDTIPRDAPRENIKTMVKAAKKYGVYS
jgi:MtaA/CmuA family methyltransferase